MIRIGIGSDIHKLEDGRDLIIGGVKIPFHKGLSGHSDADVLTHAIIDALLGAASLGDIGRHFPSSDERWRGISSLALLERTMTFLTRDGFEVINVDATITAERPRLSDRIPEMVCKIAALLNLKSHSVSIKSTTSKGVGPVGREEAVSAVAVVLIEKAEG